MAHPYVFQENFESGDNGNFDQSDVDGGGALTFPHWRTLAKQVPRAPMPFRGAYIPQIELSLVDGSGAYMLDNTSFDAATSTTRSIRFNFYVSSDLVMAASDDFEVMVFRAASANTVTVAVRNNAGTIEIGAGQTVGTTRTTELTLGEWHTVELTMLHDGDSGADGTIAFFLDGNQVGATLTSLTQAAVTNFRLGVNAIDAGTTAGRVYYDQLVYDDARVFPHRNRKPEVITITDSEHIFVGPGVIASAALMTSGSSNILYLYDTDVANIDDNESRVVEIDLAKHNSAIGPWYFQNGCYAELTGTDPRGTVVIEKGLQSTWRSKLFIYESSNSMRTYANRN